MRVGWIASFSLVVAALASAPLIAAEPASTTQSATKLARLDEQSILDRTAALSQYTKQPNIAGIIRTRGGGDASMLVTRWANDYCTIYPKVQMEILGGGAEMGLPALLDGKVDIMPIVRNLSGEELAKFNAKFGYPPMQVVVAFDAMAIYVHQDNPIERLTTDQLEAIYSRASRHGQKWPETWGDLGVPGKLAELPIARLSLNEAHSSYLMFRTLVLGGEDFRFDTRFERVAGGLIDTIAADPAAIGFTSVMFESEGTRYVPVVGADGKAYLPNYANSVSGAYPFARKIVLVINKPPGRSLPPHVVEFLRFAVSRRGQQIAGFWGSYPLMPEHQAAAIKSFAP